MMQKHKTAWRTKTSLTHGMILIGQLYDAERCQGDDLVTWPEFGSIHPFAPLDQQRVAPARSKDPKRSHVEITGYDDFLPCA
ncbi:hypothetical protein OK016_22350 [Vibrio chagasii]|nr:hypothetical protein [Vibrio chagasii]